MIGLILYRRATIQIEIPLKNIIPFLATRFERSALNIDEIDSLHDCITSFTKSIVLDLD